MTPAELRATLDHLGWSARQLGEMLEMHPKTPQHWLLGRAAVPPDVADWLQRRAACLRADPPPTRHS